MKITRAIVVDLLPLYVAGEASPDTRALVEEYLQGDNDLAEHVRAEAAGALLDHARAVPPLRSDIELQSLKRTRALLRWQRLSYSWALTLSFLSLSSVFSLGGGRLQFHFLLRDYPRIFIPCVLLALSCWVNYVVLRRRVRVSTSRPH